jgi:hypothetical protein
LRELVDSHGVEASFTITSMLDEIRA